MMNAQTKASQDAISPAKALELLQVVTNVLWLNKPLTAI